MARPGLIDLGRGLVQLLFPNSCLICDVSESDQTPLRHGLCSDCHHAVTSDRSPSCPRCGSTVGPHSYMEAGCTNCRGEALSFESVIRLGSYENRLRDAVIRMKLSSGESLAGMMGRIFCETACDRLRTARVEVVVPVPLHWRREWGRGHNQAASVAEELASGLGVRFVPRGVRRVRYTPQQVQPSAAARRENVRGAFRVRHRASVAGKRILLVDDVMTTGSTASEVARTLRQAGAQEVIVAVLARR